MIKVEINKTELEGHPRVLISELAYAFYHVKNLASEKLGISPKEVENDVIDMLRILSLTESGMDIEEAITMVKGEAYGYTYINEGDKNGAD